MDLEIISSVSTFLAFVLMIKYTNDIEKKLIKLEDILINKIGDLTVGERGNLERLSRLEGRVNWLTGKLMDMTSNENV